MRISKEFQKEAVRVWNPKDNTFYPLINFNSFPVLFKVMKKKFPRIFELFYCKNLLQRTWGLPYSMSPQHICSLVCCLPPSSLEASGVLAATRNTLNSCLSVLLCEMKVIMLLTVQVQPLCTFREIFVLFLISQVLVPRVIAMLFGWFYLTRQNVKGSMP